MVFFFFGIFIFLHWFFHWILLIGFKKSRGKKHIMHLIATTLKMNLNVMLYLSLLTIAVNLAQLWQNLVICTNDLWNHSVSFLSTFLKYWMLPVYVHKYVIIFNKVFEKNYHLPSLILSKDSFFLLYYQKIPFSIQHNFSNCLKYAILDQNCNHMIC